MRKYFLSIVILAIYGVTIIYPYYLTSIVKVMDSKNDFFILHYGIIHYPSVLFIMLSTIFLHWSVKSETDKLSVSHKKIKNDLENAIETLDLKDLDHEKFKVSENPFCKDIKYILLNGGIEEDIELTIKKHISSIGTSYERLINEYGYIATILPMLGMIGTITGLLQMFAIGNGVDNFSDKLASLSVALATTLYATLCVVFFTKPKSREIENWLVELENVEYKLVINSKLYMHNTDISLLFDNNVNESISSISESEKKIN